MTDPRRPSSSRLATRGLVSVRVASLLTTMLWLFGPLGCSPSPETRSNAEKLLVFASIPPVAYFAERIGGDHVVVEVLLPPGRSPATYEPSARQIARLAEASAYFRIGLPFEDRLVEKIGRVHKRLKIIDLRAGIEMLPMSRAAGADDSGRRTGQPDPHIWLDPGRAKIMARTICEQLCRLDPSHAGDYRGGLQALVADLDSLKRRLAAKLARFKGRAIYVFHPAYGYFADAFGLEQVAVEQGGKQPGARRLAQLIEKARQENTKAIFVQPQFSRRQAEAIARSIGCDVVALDPLARNYLRNLEDIAEKIARALE